LESKTLRVVKVCSASYGTKCFHRAKEEKIKEVEDERINREIIIE
jgi:hypothetical protein